MGAGRPRQAAKIKQLKGTFQPCREKGQLESYCLAEAIPAPPEHFTDKTKMLWDEKLRILQTHDMLDKMDFELLEQYFQQYQIVQAASRAINEEGMVIEETNSKGFTYKTKNPNILILNDATKQMLSIGCNFGFTPASRAKLKAPTPETQSKLSKMIRG